MAEQYDVQVIDSKLIVPSPAQPRRFKKNGQDIAELAESIKAQGLLQPITVRPIGGGKYEIVFGERRYMACCLAGEPIACIVRDLSDARAYEMTVTENLQREDLTPGEEAAGVKTLLDGGRDVKEIADHLGKPVHWVARRAKLQDLVPWWKKKMENPSGDHYTGDWTAAHFELIARFDTSVQERMAKELRIWDKISVKELDRLLSRYCMKISSAPWGMGDAELIPAAGACNVCQKRSSTQPDLFDANKSDEKGVDECTDKVCWSAKMKAFIERKRDALLEEHSDLILVDHSDYQDGTLDGSSDLKKKAVKRWAVDTCKKTDKGAKAALIVDGPGAGTIRWVKESHSGSTRGASGKKDKPKSLKERRAALEKRRRVMVLKQISEAIEKEIKAPALVKKVDPKVALKAVINFGCRGKAVQSACRYDEMSPTWSGFDKVSLGTANAMIAEALRNVLPIWKEKINNIAAFKPDMAYASRVCALLGINVKSIEKQVETNIKEPKALAALNADGTPKKSLAKKKPADKRSKKATQAA
jgi:ParB/RepB/Spo0J family partition protein